MRRHMTVKPLQRQSIAKTSKISMLRRAKTADAFECSRVIETKIGQQLAHFHIAQAA